MGECVNTSELTLYERVLESHCSERNLQSIFPLKTTSFGGTETALRVIFLLPLTLVSFVGLCFFLQNYSKTIIRQTNYRYIIVWMFFIGVVFISGFLNFLDLFEIAQQTTCSIDSVETCACYKNNISQLSSSDLDNANEFISILVSWKYTVLILYITMTLSACSGYFYYPNKWYISFVFFIGISISFAIAADMTANVCNITVPETFSSEECYTKPVSAAIATCDSFQCQVLECSDISNTTQCENCPLNFKCNAIVLQTDICKNCKDIVDKIKRSLCSLPFNVLSLSYSIFALICVLFVRTRDEKCHSTSRRQKNNVIDPLHNITLQDNSEQCNHTRFRWW